MNSPLHGLYAITDPTLMGDRLLADAELAIRGGIRLLQYRNKLAAYSQQEAEAAALLSLCRAQGVRFIINDNPRLAVKLDADGVHLGQSDSDIAAARHMLGEDKIIGITCHASLKMALAAEKAGANYVAFGRFFPSQSKPDAPPAEIDILQQARHRLSIPLVAIGGITPENGGLLINAGADMLAVIHGIFAANNVLAAVQHYAELFD